MGDLVFTGWEPLALPLALADLLLAWLRTHHLASSGATWLRARSFHEGLQLTSLIKLEKTERAITAILEIPPRWQDGAAEPAILTYVRTTRLHTEHPLELNRLRTMKAKDDDAA